MKIFQSGKVQLFFLILVLLLNLAARQLHDNGQAPDKSRPQKSDDCFDMGAGTAICLAKVLTKLYPLMKYNPEPAENPQSFAAKHNLAPYIAFLADLVDSLQSKRPTGEAVSKATGAFVGDHVVSVFTENLLGRWKKKWGFRSGSLVGAYVGGKVGVMAYDVYRAFHYLYSFSFHGIGKVSSFVDKEL